MIRNLLSNFNARFTQIKETNGFVVVESDRTWLEIWKMTWLKNREFRNNFGVKLTILIVKTNLPFLYSLVNNYNVNVNMLTDNTRILTTAVLAPLGIKFKIPHPKRHKIKWKSVLKCAEMLIHYHLIYTNSNNHSVYSGIMASVHRS